jgi:hypothetical protein
MKHSHECDEKPALGQIYIGGTAAAPNNFESSVLAPRLLIRIGLAYLECPPYLMHDLDSA